LILLCAGATAQETPAQQGARLHEQAEKLWAEGKYREGIDVAQRALALREQALGSEHPDVGNSWQILGRLHEGAGDYKAAITAHLRALSVHEKSRGSEHADTARSLTNLANTYVFTGDYSKAEPLYQRALAIYEKLTGNEYELSRSLLGLGNVYVSTAAYERAEPLYQRVLAIRERIQSPDDPSIAMVLGRLGWLYHNTGEYARAERTFQRALVIREKANGPEHPENGPLLNNLANVYSAAGKYVEAEALFKRALAVHEKAVGREHPSITIKLIGLGNLYLDVGAYTAAERAYRRALAIQKKAPGPRHYEAIALNGLAAVYLAMGRLEQADQFQRRALEIAEQSLGNEAPTTAAYLQNLGEIQMELGAPDRAEPLLERGLMLIESALGAEHRNTADALSKLADLYLSTGAYLEAQALLRRAIAIYEKTLGPAHPTTARALGALAVAHWAAGETEQALPLLQRAQGIRSKNAERLLAVGSAARKQDYLRSLADDTFGDVSFTMATPGAAATELGMTSVLRYKGRVLDIMSDSVDRLRRSAAPADQALLEQLADVAGQRSALTYGQAGNFLSSDQYRRRLTELTARQEQLETELASRSQAFSRELIPVTVAAVKQSLPAGSALVEWFRYIPLDPKRKGTARQGSPRYVAYVLKRDAEPVAIDMGEAQPIEALVHELRSALGDPARTDVKQHAGALSDKLFSPLRAHLNGVSHLLISPDGELHLVPMAALLDQGVYLAERFNVSYLTSGRDLLRMGQTAAASADAVVFAHPDYGRRSAAAIGMAPALQTQRSTDLDRSGLRFRPLAGTALEAQELKKLLKLDAAHVLLGADATEATLKQLAAPRILHIASHGFFLNDQQLAQEMNRRRGTSTAPLLTDENPLLRSGIALAGANARSSGKEDGILTALEATQLDLVGTELVVLSACDSGIGEVLNGEGVYGLRRALTLAGAQTQLTSLWKVSDEATRNLMVSYYQRLLQGAGRSAALRDVQRAMLANPALSHPYYWASFVPIGDWRALPSLSARTSAGN
jgi:CHAT domain-containing protein/Flp pilus assembly protein TadD